MSVLAALLACAGPLTAQSASVRTAVDTTRLTVGDRVRLTVRVEHGAGSRVVWPDSLNLGPFEVLSARAAQPAAEGGRVVSTAEFTLTAFELGELEIPSFQVEVEGPSGRETVATDRFGLEVVSVGADEGGDIRGIRGPLSIPVSVVWVGGLVVGLVVLALLALWLIRRYLREDRDEVVSDQPPRPAHEVALEALDQVAASDLLDRDEVKEFHIRVSEILRRYVEDRFAVPALEMTTYEVVGGLVRVDAPGTFRDGLQDFLERCDLVKFAKARPGADRARAVLDDGRELVRSTIPVAEPEPAAAATTGSAPAGADAASAAPGEVL